MSEDDAEVIRALAELWNSGERRVERLAQYLDPAIRLESPLSSLSGEPYRGYAGVERWARDLDDQFSEWVITVEELSTVDDRVLTSGKINARGRASGLTLEFTAASVSHFTGDHRVARIYIYSDVEEALKAVGRASR